MRKVILKMNEQFKYETIKKLVETDGNKTKASIRLQCSIRTINRLCKTYINYGKAGFVHKNSGKKPITTISLDNRDFITNLYTESFEDANLTHFCEILKEDYGISISVTTLNRWLREINILSPKAHRRTRKNLKTKLRAEKKAATKSEQKKIEEAIDQIDSKSAHPTRSRCKYMGEMIQMDASEFHWVPGVVWHLHVAIDDASGNIVGAYFDYQETLKGYYNVFFQILSNYGIPNMFYTDRRTVFEYKRKNTLLDDENTFTQFAYGCHQLGVEIKTTSIAQAKGRVERLNETLQSRLPIELRRNNIISIEEANLFLNSYIQKYNQQFALYQNSSKNAFEKQPTKEVINQTLAILSTRVIDYGHCIKYKNKVYMPINANSSKQYFQPKTECLMIEAFDNCLYVSINEKVYGTIEIPPHELVSKKLDPVIDVPKKKKIYIPPMTHPWRTQSFITFKKHQDFIQKISANV
ncbi:MAG: ISNCY family transposase [Erysipelotrichaceae bacterium]